MKTVKIFLKKSPGTEDLAPPRYMSEGASGMDLRADVKEPVVIPAGEIRLIPTGISIAVPRGYEAQIRPRSGLALNHGVTLLNTPGTIDSDYRGIVSLIVANLGREPYRVTRGARLAQMVIQRVERAEFEIVDDIADTARAAGGFGHTGV